tara:strand:- start:9567 stop:10256 length:690 start_codon:yes stop_codon:yes gene_type:complete
MNKIRKAVVDLNGEWPAVNEDECYLVLGSSGNDISAGKYQAMIEPFNDDLMDRLFAVRATPWIDVCTREQFDEEVKKWKEEWRGEVVFSNGKWGNNLDEETAIEEKEMTTKHQPFKGTLGEFAERYINGDTFHSMDSGHAYALPDNIKAVDLKGYYQSGVFELVEPVWYENLGDGVLCWVWDSDQHNRPIELVINYNHNATRLYETIGDSYSNAQPLTKEEAMRFVWGE